MCSRLCLLYVSLNKKSLLTVPCYLFLRFRPFSFEKSCFRSIVVFLLKPGKTDTLRWLRILLISFCQDHDQFLSKSQLLIEAKFERKVFQWIWRNWSTKRRLNVLQHSKKYDELYRTTRTTWKYDLGRSSHQFMSSSALFVPFQDKNVLHFINTWLSNWKVFFEILRNDCLDVYDQ